MHKDFGHTYWKTSDNIDNQCEANNAHFIGIPTSTQATNKATTNNLDLDNALGSITAKEEVIFARQAFQILKTGSPDIIMPLPHKCTLNAPDSINVYTDGSWLNPVKQYLGIGGAGVWWPHRTLSKTYTNNLHLHLPISSAEHDMALHHATHHGVRLYTKIGGYGGSSTRTELAAGIIAICAHGPVHIGSDSEAFVNTANSVLCTIRNNKKPDRSWKLISDVTCGNTFTELPCKKDQS